MRPAETSECLDQRREPASLEHVTRADCATPHQEALVVALALRSVLDDAGDARPPWSRPTASWRVASRPN